MTRRFPRMLKAFLVSAVAGAGLLASPALANGPYEPNDDLGHTAGFPASGITASLETTNDSDWYRVALAGSSQVTVTLTARARCWEVVVELLDDLGTSVMSGSALVDPDNPGRETVQLRYSTPLNGGNFILRVYPYGGASVGCEYSLAVTPAEAIRPDPLQPPRATVPEPNAAAVEPFGPLSGDVLYEGTIENALDKDEGMFFFARGGSSVVLEFTQLTECEASYRSEVTVTGPNGLVKGPGDRNELMWFFRDNTRIRETVRIPSSGGRYLVSYYYASSDNTVGCRWQFRIGPASAITNALTGGPPARSKRCVEARKHRARRARQVASTKRQLRNAASPTNRRRLRVELSKRRNLLRAAQRRVSAACKA